MPRLTADLYGILMQNGIDVASGPIGAGTRVEVDRPLGVSEATGQEYVLVRVYPESGDELLYRVRSDDLARATATTDDTRTPGGEPRT